MTPPTQRNPLARLWRDYRGLLAFLALMGVFRSSWADWVTVPTGSMNPTIIEGDRLLVDKHAYGLRVPFTRLRLTEGEAPGRGDIVVFDSPADGQSLVKRIIGLPGDEIALQDEALIVNGEPVAYAPGDARHLADLLADTAAAGPKVVREALPGRGHDILLLRARHPGPSFGAVRVPADQYLMLGDNRDNSADSRYFGFVPRSHLVGRASRVVVSFYPQRYYLPRADRVLLPLD